MQTLTANANTITDDHFNVLRDHVRKTFASYHPASPIFTTDAKPFIGASSLYDAYLYMLPENLRQQHTCNCCRQFFERHAGLVTIDEDGNLLPIMWQHAGDDDSAAKLGVYGDVVKTLRHLVAESNVTGVFASSAKDWGIEMAGGFTHLHVKPAAGQIHKDRLKAPHEVTALSKEHFRTLSHGLGEFKIETVNAALHLLKNLDMARGDKFLAPARFLKEMHGKLASTKNRRIKNHLIWRGVGTAPEGWLTPRSSVIGTLLEDLAAGTGADVAASRFRAKTDSLQYMRPQAAPSAGNIAQAEKIVEALGIANSLKRRYARLDEIRAIWRKEAGSMSKTSTGVFGHLAPTESPRSKVEIMAQKDITWAKFRQTVLPEASKIEVRLKGGLSNFTGLLTAEDPDAPPIIQWDLEEKRNPFSWYVFHGGSSPNEWDLPMATWIDVPAVMLKPFMWEDEHAFPNHQRGAVMIIDGARAVRDSQLCLFPEMLKSQLHSIRSTIEAFSRNGKTTCAKDGTANGLMVGPNGVPNAIFRVTSEHGSAIYNIDRWD